MNEKAQQDLKELMDSIVTQLPSWQQESIKSLITQAVQLAYKQGREDQRYASEGPLRSLYD